MTLTASELTSLTTTIERWEIAEYCFAALVTVACLGEYVACFTDWFTDGLEHRKKRLEKYSTLLLIGALAAELLCLVRTNQLSGQVIALMNERAQEVSVRASKLEASNKQLGIDLETEKQNTARFQKAAAETELLLGKQLLAQDRRANVMMDPKRRVQFVSHIKQFAGQDFDVVSCGIKESEIITFSMAIWSTLSGMGGWKVGKVESNSPSCGLGMSVMINPDSQPSTKQAAQGLIDAFAEQGLMPKGSRVGTLAVAPASRDPERWLLQTSSRNAILVLVQTHE